MKEGKTESEREERDERQIIKKERKDAGRRKEEARTQTQIQSAAVRCGEVQCLLRDEKGGQSLIIRG